MTGLSDDPEQFQTEGRVWLRGALSQDDLTRLDALAIGQSRPGKRLDATTSLPAGLIRAVRRIDPRARPVRVVAFNKSPASNWGVPWHQDRVIALAGQHDMPGFGNWSRKDGVWHCEPPRDLLDNMLFVRVHLDDIGPAGGGMDISLGSHLCGIVPAPSAQAVAQDHPIETETASRGDILVLKMLTLHRSRPAEHPASRRVIRIDFAKADLPAPLVWA